MTNTLILPFEYRRNIYSALITVKQEADSTEYRVTIMNGELEKLLYGHHIIIEKGSQFLLGKQAKDQNIQELQQAVMQVLASKLRGETACSKG